MSASRADRPRRKGQASLIDVLLLGFFISIALVLGIFIGEGHVQAEVTREESGYAQSMLLAAMNYRAPQYGGYSNAHNLSLAEAIDLHACRGIPPKPDLRSALGTFFNKTVKPGYSYIFYFRAGNKTLHVWNRQENVSAGYLPLKTFDLIPTCPTNEYTPPTLGIWPGWKELPLAE
ncbi:MAG: hypothetical protein ACE5FW_00130 [Candidatus Aenigmatarchaeota archaeon]